tara:strand:- start:2622 stop:3311 length:690 start_codon:yes stop_codon:yes gene_type:complete
MNSFDISHEKSFEPNLTTAMLYEASRLKIHMLLETKSIINILELGCGCGIISLMLKDEFKDKINVFLSDIEIDSTNEARNNFERFGISGDIRTCSLFDDWEGVYDVVINDISGVSEPIANLSPWFLRSSCATGNSGTKLLEIFFENVGSYVKKDSTIFFPILSLSQWDYALKHISESFSLSELKIIKWPVPGNINSDKLLEICNDLNIDIEEKFGNLIAWTKVYNAVIK